MQIGTHALVFTGTFDRAGISSAVQRTARAGFDLIEFPLMDVAGFDRDHAAAELAHHGVDASASLGLDETTDLTSADSEVAARGEQRLRECLEIVAALGGQYLCGVIYSAMRKYPEPATDAGRERSAAALRRLADRAEGLGVTLALEVVNRYETNLLNTSRQALAFLDEVGHPGVGVHLDTYHMNIEEADLFNPVVDAGERLRYVHVGEGHRGYLGSGTVAFGELFRALDRLAYDGPVVFESFSSAVVNADLSRTLAIWRNLWSDGDDLAAHANRLIRDGLHAARSIRGQ